MAESLGQNMVIDEIVTRRRRLHGRTALRTGGDFGGRRLHVLMMSSKRWRRVAARRRLRSKLAFDIGRDLSPVSLVTVGPMMLVRAATSLPVRTVKELIALAHSQPGKLKYGTSGAGGTVASFMHLTSELFNSMAKA